MGVKTNYRTNRKNEVEIGKKTIDEITKSRQFEPDHKEPPRNKYFIFRWQGDEITGVLGAPIPNFRRNTSYPIKKEDGETVEIFGNKILHEIIRRNELVGSKVRIVYIGRQGIPHCRPRKIYRVFKIIGTIRESKSEQFSKQPKSKRTKKQR